MGSYNQTIATLVAIVCYSLFVYVSIKPFGMFVMAKRTKPSSTLGDAVEAFSKDLPERNTIPAEFDLEQSVPYLMNRVGVGIGNAFSEHLRRFDISLTGYRVLASLVQRDGQGIVELALHTSIDVSTLSRLVNTLETKSLLKRERDDMDARAFKLFLQPEGRQLAAQTIPIGMLLERLMIAGLSKDEVDLLRSVLRRMYDNLAPVTD